VQFYLGNLALVKKQLNETAYHFERYQQLAQSLTRIEPQKSRSWVELSYAKNSLGTLDVQLGNSAKAQQLFEESIQWKRKALAEDPSDNSLKADLADSLSWLGSELENSGHLEDAGRRFNEGVQIAGEAMAAAPSDLGLAFHRVTIQLLNSKLKLAMGNSPGARLDLDEARRTLENLIAAEPKRVSWRRNLWWVRNQLLWLDFIDVLTSHGSSAAILQAVDVNRQELARELKSGADGADLNKQLITLQVFKGIVLNHIGRYSEAIEVDHAAVVDISEFAQATPTDIENKSLLCRALIAEGEALQHDGKLVEAAQNWTHVVDLIGGGDSKIADKRLLDPLVRALVSLGRVDEARRIDAQLLAMGYSEPLFRNFLRRMNFVENR